MRIISVLGKGGTGKTFVASNLAMAMGHYGKKTLLIGADFKKDTSRCVTSKKVSALFEELEKSDFNYQETNPKNYIVPINEYVDVIELGGAPIITGHYGHVINECFVLFQEYHTFWDYDWVIWDVNSEDFGGSFQEVFRRSVHILGVTDGSLESLFVINRLIKTTQIAKGEYSYPAKLFGLVPNKLRSDVYLKKFTKQTNLLTFSYIPEQPQLQQIRHQHQTLFSLENPNFDQQEAKDTMARVADLINSDPVFLKPILAMEDDDLWNLHASPIPIS
ncbi:MAG: nitrogenase subunit NifH [bacterium]|jgi:nitrogenase subunit NifH